MMRTLLIASAMLAASVAHGDPAGRDLCARGVRHHGAPIDLDVKGADIHDVFRLIADIGRVNVVVPDDVAGKVTVRLVHIPWDAVACAVADLHHLAITAYDNILVVTPAGAPPGAPSTR